MAAEWTGLTSSGCGRRWDVVMLLTAAAVVVSSTAERRPTSMNICERDPADIRVDSMPGDHGFRIQVLGHAVRYTPGQVYTGQCRCLATDTSLLISL